METVEQVNENFNAKKPKKKGLMISGIVAAVLVVALVLVYFLVLSNPKFIFSKTIDKLLAVDTENYDSIKMDAEIKASVDLEDTTYQTELAEIEKLTVKTGVQMDAEAKQEIVDLGLEYDNQAVIDARVYYNDGEMYAYLEGLFDKYIELDMDAETKATLDEMFETVTSEENLKNTEKAVGIMRDELKAQIKENGEFEKKKDEIEVGDDEVKVTKSTLTISEKQLYKIAGNMLTNLAKDDEFLDCFEESPKDLLKEAAAEIKDLEGSSKNNVKISLYTKGLLNNNLVAVAVEIYSEDDESTIVAKVVKEDEDIYSYSVSGKSNGIKIDFANGKVEIQKDKDTKKEQSGKAIITAEIIEIGNAKLEVDYSVEYNQGIDKINTSNSVNMNNLTEEDFASIETKLMERPLIGEVIKEYVYGGIYEEAQDAVDNTQAQLEKEKLSTAVMGSVGIDGKIDFTQLDLNLPDGFVGSNGRYTSELGNTYTVDENGLIILEETENDITTTSQNEVKDEYSGYSVKYSVPTGFVYSEYSYDDMKFYDLENADYSYIDATVSLDWYTEAEYIEDEINWDYDYYLEDTDYHKNVNLSEVKTVVVGDKTFKYVLLSYETTYGTKSQDVYIWYPLGEEYLFTVELEATDTEVTEDMIKGFLDITVTE